MVIDLVEEKEKWVKEWGDEVADEVDGWVKETMEDYIFLAKESI